MSKRHVEFLGMRSLSSFATNNDDDEDGLTSFMPTIMVFTVIVGLSLDYDTFLITRAYEYRVQ